MQLSHNATIIFDAINHLSETACSRYSLSMIVKPATLRFDDRLDTVLRIDPTTASGRATLWRQILDVLAQSGEQMSDGMAERCLRVIAQLRETQPVDQRVASITALRGRLRYAPLVALFGQDHPRVVRATMQHATLSTEGWLAIMPEIGPLGRSFLRERGDLDDRVRRALAHFGRFDLTLPAGNDVAPVVPLPPLDPAPAVAPDTSAPIEAIAPAITAPPSDIAALVQRIDSYRAQRAQAREVTPNSKTVAFFCDIDGLVRAVDSTAPHGRFVGISLSEPARLMETGCDAGVARAFAKRTAIRDGRLMLPDDERKLQLWLIHADPQFDTATGRFTGYRGQMHASSADVVVDAAAEADATVPPIADSMRQLVHELRSPLNAINGFAQMIHGQFYGPVSNGYRDLSQRIMGDALRLSAAIDDIDLAARLDSGRLQIESGACDALHALRIAIHGEEARLAPVEPAITVEATDSPRTIALEEASAVLLMQRLIRALALEAGEGGQTRITFCDSPGEIQMRCSIERDPADDNSREGDGLMGPDFAFRLVEQLAQSAGGNVSRSNFQYLVNLPLIGDEHHL